MIARLLRQWGVRVSVDLAVDPSELSGDAATAFAPLQPLGIRVRRIDEDFSARLLRREWIVDAVLGTGVSGLVRPPFLQAIERINAARRRVLAVDLPSGLDADSGRPWGIAVQAERTATFVARKAGFDHLESARFTGPVHVVEIEIGRAHV